LDKLEEVIRSSSEMSTALQYALKVAQGIDIEREFRQEVGVQRSQSQHAMVVLLPAADANERRRRRRRIMYISVHLHICGSWLHLSLKALHASSVPQQARASSDMTE
jgi:hypothetical protein